MNDQYIPRMPDPEELWSRHSEFIAHDMFVISRFAGTVVMTKPEFMKMWEELSNIFLNQVKEEAESTK